MEGASGSPTTGQPASNHDLVASDDILPAADGERRRVDFEGIWNPAPLSDGQRSSSSSGSVSPKSSYSDDTDDSSINSRSRILETRRERYARERQLSWSLPPAYDDLPDPNSILTDEENVDEMMDRFDDQVLDRNSGEVDAELRRMLTDESGELQADEKDLAALNELAMSTADDVGLNAQKLQRNEEEFPPLPPSSAAEGTDNFIMRQPWHTPKYAKNFLAQQQQIQKMIPQKNVPYPPYPAAVPANILEASHASVIRFPGAMDRRGRPESIDREKERPQKSLTIKDFQPYLGSAGLSLFSAAMDLVAQTVSTNKLVSLSFTGLDQLTDIFFRILLENNIILHLKTFSASGCVLLTDAAVRWLSEICPLLEEVNLVGCRKITSASLAKLLKTHLSLKMVDMSCTNVTTLPLSYGNSKVQLQLDGCPMICPTKKALNKIYLKEPESYVADGTKIIEDNEFKLIILKSGKQMLDLHLGKYLKEGPYQLTADSMPEEDQLPMTITRGVVVGNHRFNVYEVNRIQAAQDLVISDGSICIFPFYLEKCTPDRQDHLSAFFFRKIAYVLSHAQYIAPVLIGFHDGKMEGKESEKRLQNLKNGVEKLMETCIKSLREKLNILIKRKWFVHGYDIQGQLRAGDAAVMLDKLQSTQIFSQIIDTHRKVNPQKFLKDAIAHVKSSVPWTMVNCVETKTVMDRILQEKGPILSFTETEAPEMIRKTAEEVGFSVHKMHQPYLKTIARVMNQKGSLLYFSEADGCPLITDPGWFSKVLGILMNPPPPDEAIRRQIRFIGNDLPIFKKGVLKEALAGLVPPEHFELLLSVLLDNGIIFECAVDRITESEVPYVYVAHDLLGNQPHIPLADLWPEVISYGRVVVQRNKHYHFSCGAPLSLYSRFLGLCAKIFKFTLLWKYGFLIRQGVVDVLVDLEANDIGEPVICVSARTEYQQSEATAVRVNCVWSVMNKVTSILEYSMKRYSCFANAVVPCPTCIPTMNNGRIVKDDDVWLYYVTLLKSGGAKGLKCRSKKYKCSETPLNNTRTVEQLLGPDGSLVPQHFTSQLTACLDATSDYNRCALCQGCTIRGRECPGYDLMGKTARHCACEEIPSRPLCLSCGTCQRCENLLKTLHTSRNPQSFRNAIWKEYRRDGLGKPKGKKASADLDGRVVQHPKYSWFHTQKGFLYVLDNVNFCPELFDVFEILYFRGMKACVGLVRDDHSPIVTFNPTEGCFGSDWSFEGAESQKIWKIKDCTLFAMKINYLPVGVREETCDNHDATYALDFFKSGEKIHTTFLPARRMKVALTGSGAGSMMLQTPTMSTRQPLTLTHPDAKEDKLYVEVERQDSPNHLVLCSIKVEEDNKFLVTTEDGPKQMARDDPKIHPLGYAFASGTERTLFLLPKHREMSSVPTMYYKRKKKKPQATTKDTAIVACVEDLNTLIEKKIVLPAPLWFFTEEQRKGWEPSIIDLCNCQRFYESTEAQLCAYTRSMSKYVEWVRLAVEEQLAYEFLTPMLLLPAKIDAQTLMYPVKPPHDASEMFQAVQLCASSAEKLDLHLLNMKGITLSEKQGDLTNFFLPFHVYMSLGCKVVLPGYDKMLPDVAASIAALDDDRVQYYFREFLLYITACLMMFNDGNKLPEPSGLSDDTMAFIDSVLERSAAENQAQNMGNAIALCPAHREKDKIDPNDFDDIPQIKRYLQFLKAAKLEQTVETLPEDFFQRLCGLEEFVAERCVVKKLPSSLGSSANLTTLKLAGSKITQLPSDLVQLENKLKELDISHLNTSALPDVITKLTKLEILTADCLLLNSLPDTIGNLENLREFSLVGSCLHRLPMSFAKLTMLTKLNLSGVPWPKIQRGHYLTNESFEEFLAKWNLKNYFETYEKGHGDEHGLLKPFDEDSNLTLDPTEMGKLNANLFNQFSRLGYHEKNKPDAESTGGFPPEILELVNLTHLNLSYQGIVSIPEDIGRLSKLESLILSENPYLTALPGTVGGLPLERLDLSQCPSLRTPPREIISKGLSPVMAYLRRLTTGSVECKRTKLMLVGLGGAGKTSLVKALVSGTNKAYLASGQDITDGIDIHSWTVAKSGDSVTYSVWDFAGQTVYYNTHQFFLSNRAIYLLLWNLRLGAEHAGLDFWLSSISVHAPEAPILVVGSHLDQVEQFAVPTQLLKKRYPQIVGFYSISTLTGMGVSELKEALFAVTLQEKYMGESIPEVWLNFEKAVLSERANTNVITYQRVEEIAYASGIFDELETTQAVRFLHDLGTVQHFDNEFLKDQVVINPQWIVDVMACVVSVKDSPIKDGKFKHSDVPRVWHEHPKKLHNWLLRLTEKFDLTFPLPEQALNLVPCLLPETEPEVSWPEVGETTGFKETKMLYRFEYLPVGLFNRSQVRLYGYCDSSIIWKKGSLLRKNGHIALLSQHRDNELMVKCQGPRPENLVLMIHEVFETLIQESFKGVVYDYKVPCPDCLCLVRDPYMFRGSTIRRAAELKTPFLQCSRNFHVLSIPDLIGVCPPSDGQDYDLHLKNTVHSLADIRLDLSVEVFISYCQADVPEQDGIFVDPRKIKDSIEENGYRCWFETTTKKESLEERIHTLRDAKLFLVMMSNNYTNDEDCCSLFKFARAVLKKPLILVTVGPQSSSHDWKQSTLGMLVADEVYCNMQRTEHYKIKIQELLTILREKLKEGTEKIETAPCFFSYCWKNSKRAVELGQKSSADAIGYSDPRDMKDYLAENGVRSWIDIERAGTGGLFEDIAEGLRDAKVMVACLSDEYVDSLNCQMEFRFAAKVLELPIVVAVLGRSRKWRATEIGMLSLRYPQVNFEDSLDDGMRKLLESATKFIDVKPSLPSTERCKRDSEQTRASYQELCELAQRKALRQLTGCSDVYEMDPFPRVIIVDFVEPDEDENSDRGREKSSGGKPVLTKRASSSGLRTDVSFLQRNFCLRFCCEHEQGWHVDGKAIAIPMPPTFRENHLIQFSPYLARIMAVVKHSSKISLNCIGGEEGNKFIKWLEEKCEEESGNFKKAYRDLRRFVSKTLRGKSCGDLARCLTTSGKVYWLCGEHQKNPHITLMGKVATQSSSQSLDVGFEGYMLEHLKPLKIWEEQAGALKEKEKPVTDVTGTGYQATSTHITKSAPTPKPRTSVTRSKEVEAGTSTGGMAREFNPRRKFKATGYVAQASVKAKNYQKGSKSCTVL